MKKQKSFSTKVYHLLSSLVFISILLSLSSLEQAIPFPSLAAAAVVGPGDQVASTQGQSKFTFAILGDTQLFKPKSKNGGLQRSVEQLKDQEPAFVMTVGDLIPECREAMPCKESFDRWKEIMEPLLNKTYAVMGNHDRSGNEWADKVWQEEFSLPTNGPDKYEELVYSFDYGNAHFVILNSEVPEVHRVSDEQLSWLEKDLSDNRKDHAFIFFHEPAFPMGPKEGKSLDVHERSRNDLWKIIDAHDVTAVFSGHEHLYSRKAIDETIFPGAQNDVHQFVVGHTDASTRDKPKEKDQIADYYYEGKVYTNVTVEGQKITVDLYRLNGEIVDSYSFENG